MFFQKFILFVIEIGYECQGGLAKTGAFQERRFGRDLLDEIQYHNGIALVERMEIEVGSKQSDLTYCVCDDCIALVAEGIKKLLTKRSKEAFQELDVFGGLGLLVFGLSLRGVLVSVGSR